MRPSASASAPQTQSECPSRTARQGLTWTWGRRRLRHSQIQSQLSSASQRPAPMVSRLARGEHVQDALFGGWWNGRLVRLGCLNGGSTGGTPNTVGFSNAAGGMIEEAAGRMPAPLVVRASCPEPSVTKSCANMTVLGGTPVLLTEASTQLTTTRTPGPSQWQQLGVGCGVCENPVRQGPPLPLFKPQPSQFRRLLYQPAQGVGCRRQEINLAMTVLHFHQSGQPLAVLIEVAAHGGRHPTRKSCPTTTKAAGIRGSLSNCDPGRHCWSHTIST